MRKFILIIIVQMFTAHTYAQILHPVHLMYASKKINNKEAYVFIKAKIDGGWHIYSVNQQDGGPQKTTIEFSNSGDYKLIGPIKEPTALTKFEKVFSMDVHFFEKSVIFSQKISLKAKTVMVVGTVKFMCCNDHQCLPPEEVNFKIPVK